MVRHRGMAQGPRRVPLGQCAGAAPGVPPGSSSGANGLPPPPAGSTVGIDLGVASFLTTSDGKHVPNPRHGRAAAQKLTTAQQALARCQPGSARRAKARARVAAAHVKIRRQRLDHAHKTALALVRAHDMIVHEDLRITNMTRSASGTVEAPGTNVAQKTRLNYSILDVGWGVFLAILTAKAAGVPRVVACRHVAAENRVSQAGFRCVGCDHYAHADVVGALNVLRAGLARRDAATAA